MTTPNDIMTSINKVIVDAYPDDKVYISLLPKDFERPSFSLECTETKLEAASRNTVKRSVRILVTCFLEVDEYGISDAEALLVRQAQLMDLFCSGYLAVGDRCLEISPMTGKSDLFAAEVLLLFEYFDDREAAPITSDPPVGEVAIKLS